MVHILCWSEGLGSNARAWGSLRKGGARAERPQQCFAWVLEPVKSPRVDLWAPGGSLAVIRSQCTAGRILKQKGMFFQLILWTWESSLWGTSGLHCYICYIEGLDRSSSLALHFNFFYKINFIVCQSHSSGSVFLSAASSSPGIYKMTFHSVLLWFQPASSEPAMHEMLPSVRIISVSSCDLLYLLFCREVSGNSQSSLKDCSSSYCSRGTVEGSESS